MSILDAPLGLQWVMEDLYAAEINCGCSSFWDAGFTVWIGDDSNGRKAEQDFHFDAPNYPPFAEAGNWLWLKSRELYPLLSKDGGPRKSIFLEQSK